MRAVIIALFLSSKIRFPLGKNRVHPCAKAFLMCSKKHFALLLERNGTSKIGISFISFIRNTFVVKISTCKPTKANVKKTNLV